MALKRTLQEKIVRLTDDHWTAHVKDEAFAKLISGKEPGHRMADYVDDQTTSLLKTHIETSYEADDKKVIKKRSMGDVWVLSNGIYNPVNVKSGLQGMNGQPNLVSMQKLLGYIFQSWIDSYYLLIIKFDVDKDISHKSYLVDLLDWTDFITYNAGPGQIMLREKEFYEAIENGHAPKPRNITEKAETLFALFDGKVKSLIDNRLQRLRRQKKQLNGFTSRSLPLDQSEMIFL